MKLLKNKFVIGVLSIAVALLVSFVAVPTLQKDKGSTYVNAVRMVTAVQEGTQISVEMVETVKAPEGLVQGVPETLLLFSAGMPIPIFSPGTT